MTFQPQLNQELLIQGASFHVAEHPSAPGMPYGQEGRTAVVYQLSGVDGKRALKVFKPRYRVPGLVSLARRLEPFGDLPGLSVCRRTLLTPQRDASVLSQHPDLIYAAIMPWIEGPTWMEVLLNKEPLTPEQSLSIARSLSSVLAGMEQESLAHCDLSGPNVLLPMLAGAGAASSDSPDAQGPAATTNADGTGARSQAPVELVDVEQMYSPGLRVPDYLPAGSSGYAHNTAHEGTWSSDADRFAGALLLAEMLGWCDERVLNAAWGESYFEPEEMQKESERYHVLVSVLRERWGDGVAGAFQQSWMSGTPVECPTFGEWMIILPYQVRSAPSLAVTTPPVVAEQSAALQPLPPDTSTGNQNLAGDAVANPGEAVTAKEGQGEDPRARALIDEAAQYEAAGDRAKALDSYRRALSLAAPASALAHELQVIVAHLERQQQTDTVPARVAPAQGSPSSTGPGVPPPGVSGTGASQPGNASNQPNYQQQPPAQPNARPPAQSPAQPPAQPYSRPPAQQPFVQPPAQPYGQPYQNYQQYPPQQPGYTYVPPTYPPPGYPVQTVVPAKKGSALPVILVVLLVLILACVGGTYLVVTRTIGAISTGIGSLAASVDATETAQADEQATGGHADPQATPVERTLALETPRTLKYADLQFAVTDGIITNRLPGDTPRYRSDAANLTLKLGVVNRTPDYIGVTGGRLELKLGDGSVYSDSLDESVDAQSSDEVQYDFEVPLTATWEGAQLTLAEEGKEPASIPLTGAAEKAPYPAALQAGGEATIKNPQLTFKIQDASIDLDAFGERAQLGKRYLVLKVVVSSQEPKYDAYVGPESFRVIIDGKPVGPEQLSPAAEAVKAATEQDFIVAFVIPSTPGNAELQVGEVDKETAKIPLSLQVTKP